MYSKIENRNIILFSLGKGISVIGTMLYTFAIGLYVLKTTGSGEKFALTLAIGVVPTVLLGPIAGVWIEGLNKKKIGIVVDLLNAFTMFYLSSLHDITVFIVYASTLIMNVSMVFYGIAIEVIKPYMVSEAKIGRINGISKMIDGFASVVAPIMGGALILIFPIKIFMFVNGISFMFSALAMVLVDVVEPKQYEGQKQSFYKAIREAIDYISENPSMKKLIISLIALNFYLGLAIEVPVPYILNQVLRVRTEAYGLIMAGFPVGLIVGVILLEKLKWHHRLWYLIEKMNLGMCVLTFLIGLPLLLNFKGWVTPYYFGIMCALGVAISFIDIPIMVYLQTVVPSEIRSRIMGIISSFVKLALPFALVISGVLLNKIPLIALVMFGGIVAVLSQIYLKIENNTLQKSENDVQ